MTINNMTAAKIVDIVLKMNAANAAPDKIALFLDSLADAHLSANITAAAPAPAPAPAPKTAKKFIVLLDGTVASADATDFDANSFRTR